MVIQLAEVINLPFFFFFLLAVTGNLHIHPPGVGVEMCTNTVLVDVRDRRRMGLRG